MARRLKKPNWKLLQDIVKDGSTYKMAVLGLQDTFVTVPVGEDYGKVQRSLLFLAAQTLARAQDESVLNKRFEAGDYGRKIPLDRIEASPKQPPWRMDSRPSLMELMNSIEENGLIEPPTVRPHPTKVGYYRALNGHRRLAAMRKIGYAWAICNVVHKFDRDESALLSINNTTRDYKGADHFYTWAKTDPDMRDEYLNGLRHGYKIRLMVEYLGLDRAVELALNYTAPQIAVTAQSVLTEFGVMFPELTEYYPTATQLVEHMLKHRTQKRFRDEVGVWKGDLNAKVTPSRDRFLRICIAVKRDLDLDDLASIKVPKVPKTSKVSK